MARAKTIHAEGNGYEKQLNVKVPQSWIDRLRAFAKFNKRSVAAEHRAWLERYLGPNAPKWGAGGKRYGK